MTMFMEINKGGKVKKPLQNININLYEKLHDSIHTDVSESGEALFYY